MTDAPCTAKYKLLHFLLFALAYAIFYQFPNFYPLFPPVQFPLLAIDRFMPFAPWTFVIYTSDYLLMASVIILMGSKKNFNELSFLAFAVLFLCGSFFLFYPTVYPRPVYPEITTPFVSWAMYTVRRLDEPTNCFPSMHVAISAVGAYMSRVFGTRLNVFFWVWATAVFVSTLTTKQHYFVDIISGLVVATVAICANRMYFRVGCS